MPSPFFGIPDAEYDVCVTIMQAAISAWQNLVITVAAENLAMGITQSGKTQLIADALEQVMTYGSCGSLWLAYNALSEVEITPEMSPYITEARVQWMKNQLIQVIANLP
jgi:hypothetical protein